MELEHGIIGKSDRTTVALSRHTKGDLEKFSAEAYDHAEKIERAPKVLFAQTVATDMAITWEPAELDRVLRIPGVFELELSEATKRFTGIYSCSIF